MTPIKSAMIADFRTEAARTLDLYERSLRHNASDAERDARILLLCDILTALITQRDALKTALANALKAMAPDVPFGDWTTALAAGHAALAIANPERTE